MSEAVKTNKSGWEKEIEMELVKILGDLYKIGVNDGKHGINYFPPPVIHNVVKITKLIQKSVNEERERWKTNTYNKLAAKQEFVTYKRDGGHGVAVPFSTIVDLLTDILSEEEG